MSMRVVISRYARHTVLLTVCMSSLVGPPCAAKGNSELVEWMDLGTARTTSKAAIGFYGLGVVLPLLEGSREGRREATQGLEALLTSALLAEGLKRATHERRPDSTDAMSFPSGHTTAAFAVATVQSAYHPKQSTYWYLGAAAIGASRVRLDRHYAHDVLAGAALGYLTGRFFVGRGGNLFGANYTLTPMVTSPSSGNNALGITVTRRF